MSKITLFIGALAATALLVPHSRANLVSNPDFQNFTDWTQSGTFGWTSNGFVSAPPTFTSDVYTWHEGAVGGDHYLSQGLATTAGDSYSISFWLYPVGGSVSDYVVNWDGTTVFDWHDDGGTVTTAGSYSDTDTNGNSISFTTNEWNHIMIDPWATSSISVLELGNRQDPGYSDWTELDVELTGTGNSVPDFAPTSLLLGVGLAGLVALRKRRALA